MKRRVSTQHESLPEIVDTPSSDPDDLLDAAEAATDQSVAVDLLQRLRDRDWRFFERTVRSLLTAMGYGTEGTKLRATTSGDGGIDGVINRDALGLDRIYIQAKRFRETAVDSDTAGHSWARSTHRRPAPECSSPQVATREMPKWPRTAAARAWF